MSTNIHTVFAKLVQRKERETTQGHTGLAVWLTGLSGSGKSTVASAVERQLFELGYRIRVLDGDNVRSGLNNDLSFSLDDRAENNRRVAEIAKLFVETGFITLCSFISPTQAVRERAQAIIGKDDFAEVYVAANLDTCEQRDVKGLYAKARAGEIRGFTGIDSPYEIPQSPALTLHTGTETLSASAKTLIDFITARVGTIPTSS